MEIFSNSDIDKYIMMILASSFAILGSFISILLYCAKKFSGKKDGIEMISISSLVIGASLIVTGINNSNFFDEVVPELLYIIIFLIISLILIFFSKLSFNRFFLYKHKTLSRMSKAIISYAIIFSMAWTIRSLTIWIDNISFEGIKLILILYVLSEIIFLTFNFIYFKFDIISNKENSDKNLELAISYFGYRISLAFILSSVTAFVPYDIFNEKNLLIDWLLFALGLSSSFVISMKIVSCIVSKITVGFEPLAINIIKSTIYISFALVASGLIW
ncbi:MAG: hypothetical protein ACK4OM_02315 [Alphaproteobacteria bacterium]